MTTAIVYSDRFMRHSTPNHPENADRLVSIIRSLSRSEVFEDIEMLEPGEISDKDILSVHSRELLEHIKTLSETGGWIDMDTYVCIDSYEIAKLAAGGVAGLAQKAVEKRIENGFALVRPPGHHATKLRAMGFCLFNNVAIAANLIAKEGKRVLIFDHDVHHGNGTQDIFYDRKDVMYQSFHLSPHYPGTGDINEVGIDEGEGYTINIPLPRGAGDETLRNILEEIFVPIANQFKPDLIIVSAGFDSHYRDPLGGLRLSTNSFYTIIEKLKEVQSRIICSLEGGYNLDMLGNLVLSEIEAFLGREQSFKENVEETVYGRKILHEAREFFGRYWKV